MARLRCSDGNYYARFYDPARTPARKTIALGTRNEKAATAALKRLEVRYAEGRYDPWAPPEEPPLRLSEAITRFLGSRSHHSPHTVRVYRVVLQGLFEAAGDRLLTAVTPVHISAFLGSRELNDTGRESYFIRVKAFLRWCQQQGYVDAVATDRVQVRKGPAVFPHWLSRDEFNHLLAVMGRASDRAHEEEVAWLIPLVTVAAYTGLRLGELAQLRWRDVDLANRWLYVRNTRVARTKNRRDRIVPLAVLGVRALSGLPPLGPDAPVFTGAGGAPVNRDYVSKAFLRYGRQAGLPGEIHFHSLRHTCASWLVQGGMSLLRVKEILGHASIQTTMRYAHLSPSEALDEMDRAFRVQ